MTRTHAAYLAALAASVLLVAASLHPRVPLEFSPWEAVAVVSYAWSTWLLAQNRSLGWWLGLVGIAAYAVIFYQVRLFAEVAIQVFYAATSLQAIYLWLRGGAQHTERPVGKAPLRWLLPSLIVAAVATVGLWQMLIALRGAAPFWDALTTVFSLVAHLYLIGRYIESWYVWIFVDLLYIPLYASRGLYLTSVLYVVFLWMAFRGLRTFRQAYREQHAAPTAPAI